MRTLRMTSVGWAVLALAVATTGSALAKGGSTGDDVADGPASHPFPTGEFVSVDNARYRLQLDVDGTAEWSSVDGSGWYWTYTLLEDHVTWSTARFHSLSEPVGGPREFDDATYRWTYDGERLAFELVGEDQADLREALLARIFRPIEDPTVVMVATFDLDVGDRIRAWEAFVPAAEVGPDAYTSKTQFLGAVAAVPIEQGQPITPDVVVHTD